MSETPSTSGQEREADRSLDSSGKKIFNDPIHGSIELHPLCVKIIDTPQFQRLRFIKQLGASYFVFPGASHNRFEHSIGVCHLAGEYAELLKQRLPESGPTITVTDTDVLCLAIAGLCHDLGHGPFSHLFDTGFIPGIRAREGKDNGWEHEDASIAMFDHLVEENELASEFQPEDREFIKKLIKGEPPKDEQGYKSTGREKDKNFLYEIVANKWSEIDVDKWDYFARDCHMLGIRNNFDHNRFMKFSRVIEVDGELHICVRDKEAPTVYDMFHTRKTLHERAYQHPVTKVIGKMIVEALMEANEHMRIPGKRGELKMSECIYDMFAYTNLTDNVLNQILLSKDSNLKNSQDMINDILTRKLYKWVGRIPPSVDLKDEEVKEELIKYNSMGDRLTKDDIVVIVISLNYGNKDKNPMERVRFYTKAKPETAGPLPAYKVSKMFPETFSEKKIHICSKDRSEEKVQEIEKCLKLWCAEEDKKRSQPSTSETRTPSGTTEMEDHKPRPARPAQRGGKRKCSEYNTEKHKKGKLGN